MEELQKNQIKKEKIMKLYAIIPLYRQLISSNKTYGVFKYTKNNIDFDVFFDIGVKPFKIGLLLINNNFQLWINLDNDFMINPYLSNIEFKSLIRVLNLKYDPNNKFSTIKFFEDFNSKIPNEFKTIKKKELQNLIITIYNIEEENKVYYNGLIDWSKVNNGKKKTKKNIEKTRLLYPKLYERIKEKNISVRYTINKNLELEKKLE